MAVWIALDPTNRENGGLVVVPKTGDAPIDCSQVGKLGSYDKAGKPIRIPAGHKGVCHEMDAGDALVFNGSLIHGSGPNKTKDRWRRALIFHYAGESCESIREHTCRWWQWMDPMLTVPRLAKTGAPVVHSSVPIIDLDVLRACVRKYILIQKCFGSFPVW